MPRTFSSGNQDPWISKIQRALNEIIYSDLVTDGQFGESTKHALQDWQLTFKLEPTGLYEGRTAEILDAYIQERFLVDQDYANAAKKMNVVTPAVRAVTEVEAKGSGFLSTGRSTILFERHIFYKELNKRLDSTPTLVEDLYRKLKLTKPPTGSAVEYLKSHLLSNYSNLYNPSTGGYQGTAKGIEYEWQRMEKAKSIDNESALLSVSYGLFQIMGFNYKAAGFKTVDEMYTACARSERNQLDAFCNFVLADKRLIIALRNNDFLNFAIAYNGPAQRGYDLKLSQAFNKWNGKC